jgi:hypothetical protein
MVSVRKLRPEASVTPAYGTGLLGRLKGTAAFKEGRETIKPIIEVLEK